MKTGNNHKNLYQTAINHLKSDLEAFERQFKMSSEECYQRFHSGELGDGSNIFEWVALYENVLLYRQRIQKLAPDDCNSNVRKKLI